MPTRNPDEIRSTVSQAYAEALHRSRDTASKGNCCAPSCCGPSEPRAESQSVTTLSGYSDAEKNAHAEAAASSFGCGNPLAFAGVEPGQTVVDLGSGAGFDLLIAADKVGPTGRVIGVDMTDAMIDAARAAAARAGRDTIEVRKGIIEELPVDADSVDWVISNCVINLSPDKPRVFSEIARVLRPGGRFSISDIVVGELPAWIRSSAAAYSACVAGAVSEEEYLAGLRDAGLVDVEVSDRLVYDADQIRGLMDIDLDGLGLDPKLIAGALDQVSGKIASVKVTGRKPA